jgi:hypothetical protein
MRRRGPAHTTGLQPGEWVMLAIVFFATAALALVLTFLLWLEL